MVYQMLAIFDRWKQLLGYQYNIPLRELPAARVFIWSGDPRLIREARQHGLRAFCKGDLQEFQGLLQRLADRNFVSIPPE